MVQVASQPETLVARMASLADPTRLRLLKLLSANELGVVDLCEVLQMPQSTVSRHLKLLTDQGWTTSRRQGTTNLYEMPADDLDESARRLWELARDQTGDWATLKQDALRLKQRLREHRRDPEAFFADAAEQWDSLRDQLYGRSFTGAALAALLPGDWVVADLGCGTGHTAAQLAPLVAQVIAVDSSSAMLKAARKRLQGVDNVELRRGTLEELPIDNDTCDAALALIVLSYIDRPGDAMREMARVLKPGGRAVIVDLLIHDREDFRRQMDQRHMGFDPRNMVDQLESVGLTDAVCRTIPPESEAKGPALLLARAIKPTQ